MDRKESLLQNLKDAGCGKKTMESFMELDETGDKKEQVRLLEAHRKHLLDNMHEEQKKIDCLDYLLYQMKRKGRLIENERSYKESKV